MTDDELTALGPDRPAPLANKITVIKMVRTRTGWGLRESKLLVDTFCQHGRPVTYAEMRVERLWIIVNGLRAEASELAAVLEHWRQGFTEDDEAETLEDAAASLEAQSHRLLNAAYELRYERGEDDPEGEVEDVKHG